MSNISFQADDVEIIDSSIAYQGFFQIKTLALRHRLFEGGWSNTFQRELCLRKDAVGVLLYDAKTKQLAMVEQMRVGALGREQSPWLMELVAGLIDKEGEAAEAVAIRESKEEAGLEITAIEPIMRYFVSPGGSSEYFHLFCAQVDLAKHPAGVYGLLEENENIRLHIVPLEQAFTWLEQGQLNNAMAIIAVQWLKLNQQRMDTLWRDK